VRDDIALHLLEMKMSTINDAEYLRERIKTEHALAERAQDPAAYRAHLELARAYESRLEAMNQGSTAQVSQMRSQAAGRGRLQHG
jgi:hypothetical protein